MVKRLQFYFCRGYLSLENLFIISGVMSVPFKPLALMYAAYPLKSKAIGCGFS